MISVLNVDDEPNLLEIARLYFKKTGSFSVDTATSAAEGLEKLKPRISDTIVSDYQMPAMDRIAFLKFMHLRCKGIPSDERERIFG